MTPRTLEGTTTLITGASAGIGRSVAREFAAHGSDLLLLSRDGGRLKELADNLALEHRVNAEILVQDVSECDGLMSAVTTAAERRPVHTAIINAGIGQYGAFAFAPWEHIETVLRTNLLGAIATARAVLPPMVARRSGSVVFISSVLGRRAIQWNAAYTAAKFGMNGFADALRLEMRGHGVHVAVVNPARTATEFYRRMIYSHIQHRTRKVPESHPDTVARAIYGAVRHRRREVTISLGGKLFVFAGRHFPRLTDAILARAVPALLIHENENLFSTRPL